jgi:Family of unknown function (DUF6424)
MPDLGSPHHEHEDYPWTRNIPPHPPRKETTDYRRSRTTMNELAKSTDDFFYGPQPYEDHHGGGLWLKDEDGWFLIRNLAGIEWSAQFCADPKKVDELRLIARRLYARFPEAVEELNIAELLDTLIETPEDVARWTDSICNASVALSQEEHRGTLPAAAGLHHYPGPVAEIEFFKYDDFDLWHEDEETREIVAVTPIAPRGSGDRRVRPVFATPAIVEELRPHAAHIEYLAEEPNLSSDEIGDPGALRRTRLEQPRDLILSADHPFSREAFASQE